MIDGFWRMAEAVDKDIFPVGNLIVRLGGLRLDGVKSLASHQAATCLSQAVRIVIFSKTQSTSLYRLMLQQVELSMLLRKGLLLFAIIKHKGLESRKSLTGIYF